MLSRLGLLALAATSTPAGCFGSKDALHPGTDLGSFQVQGNISTNTCGDGALGEQAAWDFTVRLARDPGHLYWDNGQTVIVGTLAADGVSFGFDTSVIVDMRDPMQTGLPPCSLSRDDHAQGTLGAATVPTTSFIGQLSYTFTATAGSMCGDLTSGGTAVVSALPCGMSYELSGKHP
jgi:hypothetical protein